jgi:anthranilate synthase component II
MKLLILDNYDSFTYNLVHLVEKCIDCDIEVHRNNEISIEQIALFDKIILSPGPGLPKDAGILKDVINAYKSSKPILGVCLGMQAIGEVFGMQLLNLETPCHGEATNINVLEEGSIFKNCPQQFKVGRYHSWVLDNKKVVGTIKVIATDEQNNIMSIRHNAYNIYGVQFHPESILSEYGEQIMVNWLSL